MVRWFQIAHKGPMLLMTIFGDFSQFSAKPLAFILTTKVIIIFNQVAAF
jgi:hypothetical protein